MNQYTTEQSVGAGNYGQVVLVRHKRNGQQFVCKKIDLAQKSPQQRKESENEVKTMSKVNHPNVVGFIEAFVENNALHIIMEYADGVDLEKKLISIIKAKEVMPEREIMDIFIQIALGLRQLHKQHLLHRDLKSANVFLTSNGGVKVGDFGFSKQLNYTMALASTVCGTPYYFSPELCQKLPYNNKSDVWSLGVILYEMINLRKPFEAKTLKELRMRVVTEEPAPFTTKHVSDDLKNLCLMMLRKSSSARPSVDSVLQQPIVRQYLAQMSDTLTQQQNAAHNRGKALVGQHQNDPKSAPEDKPEEATAPAATMDCFKGGRFDRNNVRAALKSGKAELVQASRPTAPTAKEEATETQTLHSRQLPDARTQVGANAPLSVVTEITTAMVEEENARLLKTDVEEVLSSFDVSDGEVVAAIGEAQDEDEARLREILGDKRFGKAVELMLVVSDSEPGSKDGDKAYQELLKVLGDQQHLVPEIQKISLLFVME